MTAGSGPGATAKIPAPGGQVGGIFFAPRGIFLAGGAPGENLSRLATENLSRLATENLSRPATENLSRLTTENLSRLAGALASDQELEAMLRAPGGQEGIGDPQQPG